jgi:predicted exporter
MRRSPWAGIVCLAAALLCLWVVAHARYSTDLSAFLPSTPDVRQRLLVKLLRDGPASQLLLVSIEGADLATRTHLSQELAARLRAQKEFSSIANGESAGLEHDSALLFRNRYLLSDAVMPERFSVQGLTQAMQAAVAQQGATLGLMGTELLTHDPTGEMQQILALPTGSGSRQMARAHCLWRARWLTGRIRTGRFTPSRYCAPPSPSWDRAPRAARPPR